jgi:endonuclease-3
MKPAVRQEFFRRLRAANPTPQTELNYGSPFQLLIAVILSAQATDKSVNKVTESLFATAPSPLAMLELGEERLIHHIQSIGLFRSKARHIIATCKKLKEEFSGQVPRNRGELQTLPGVGRKTANVVLNTAFGVATIAVDTHIFRVANRTGLARGKDVLEVELRLLRAVPEAFRKDAHHWLILHGRYVCKARKPDCGQCLVADLCDFNGKASSV